MVFSCKGLDKNAKTYIPKEEPVNTIQETTVAVKIEPQKTSMTSKSAKTLEPAAPKENSRLDFIKSGDKENENVTSLHTIIKSEPLENEIKTETHKIVSHNELGIVFEEPLALKEEDNKQYMPFSCTLCNEQFWLLENIENHLKEFHRISSNNGIKTVLNSKN